MDTTYRARRVPDTGDVLVFEGTSQVPFGRIANCEVAYVFVAEGTYPDEELAEQIMAEAEPDFSLREWLALIRKWRDYQVAGWAAESAMEAWAEGAYVRMMEAGTMESWAEEERERAIEAAFGSRYD